MTKSKYKFTINDTFCSSNASGITSATEIQLGGAVCQQFGHFLNVRERIANKCRQYLSHEL